MSDEYPGASSYLDRHGKRRWRFRHGKKTPTRPGEPGRQDFEVAYRAAVEGRPAPQPAAVVRLPTSAAPQSLRAAWRILRAEDPEWKALGPDIKGAQTKIA